MNFGFWIDDFGSKTRGESARREFRLEQSKIRISKSIMRSGFSFTEVMFAVIILGIGFIMVAAIFPVSIQQAKSTTEETSAASIARGAVGYLSGVFSQTKPGTVTAASITNWPLVTGHPPQVFSLRDVPLQSAQLNDSDQTWNVIKNNVVLASDPRYAFIMLYKRDSQSAGASSPPATSSQIYVFVVQCRNKTTFTSDDLGTTNHLANLQPLPITVSIAPDSTPGSTNYYAFFNPGDAYYQAVVEQAYIIISNDTNSSNPGYMNGRIYRLGAHRPDISPPAGVTNTDAWELVPGNDFQPESYWLGGIQHTVTSIYDTSSVNGGDTASTLGAGKWNAYIIGRGMEDPTSTAVPPVYSGPSMAVGAFTTYINTPN